MPDENNKNIENPYAQILTKLKSLEDENKALRSDITSMQAQFKDFSDFNASLLNQGEGQPKPKQDDEAKAKRRQYLDKICREEMIK